MRKHDVYNQLLDGLGDVYGGITNRVIFSRAIREMFTQEECEIWLLFPTHEEEPAALESIRPAYDAPGFDDAFHHLLETSFITQWNEDSDNPRYVRNFMFNLMLAHNIQHEDSLIAVALADWFNILREGATSKIRIPSPEYRVVPYENALTGNRELGEIPLNLEIPDTREVVTYDYVTQMLKKAWLIVVSPCFCRSSKEAMGIRECNHPIEVCLLFNKLAKDSLSYGEGRVIDMEEALEIVKQCRERGLVHQISNSREPSILCNCCTCCCGIIGGYLNGDYTAGKPSRYTVNWKQPTCINCGKCAKVCPVHNMVFKDGVLSVGGSACIGCGLCVSRCPAGSLSLRIRTDAGKYLPDREKLDYLFL